MTPEEIVNEFATTIVISPPMALRAKSKAVEAIKDYACEICETALAERDAEISQLKARVAELEKLYYEIEDKAEYFADMNRDETDSVLAETYRLLRDRLEAIVNPPKPQP